MLYAAHFLNAFLLSVVLVSWLRGLAAPFGLLDRPSQRKAHVGLVPVVGGLAIFLAFLFALALLDRPISEQGSLLAGLTLLVAVGVVDDVRDLRPKTKLLMQGGAAVLMVVPGWHVVEVVGDILGAGAFQLGVLALPFSLLFVVALINAVNMMDGLDGLAGGVVAAALFWLALIASTLGREEALVTILLLLFATLGFLAFNLRTPWRRKASVFLGDSGSMMLGASVAYFAILLLAGPSGASDSTLLASLPALCWLLLLPVMDMASLIVRRLLSGTSPFAADRRHLHHLLLEAGLPAEQVTAVLIGLAVLLGGVGFAGIVFQVHDMVMVFGLLLPLAAHTAFVCRLPGRRRESTRVGATSDAVQPS